MTREEIEQLKTQQEQKLAAFIERVNRDIAFQQGQIAALAMVLQTPPPQEEPAPAE